MEKYNLVKRRVWTVRTWRISTTKEIAKAHFTDITSALEYVMLVDALRGEDVRIAMYSKTIWMVEN